MATAAYNAAAAPKAKANANAAAAAAARAGLAPEAAVVRLGPGMDPQQIANAMSEFGTLGLMPGAETRATLEVAVVRAGSYMTSQDVANVCFTYAKLLE